MAKFHISSYELQHDKIYYKHMTFNFMNEQMHIQLNTHEYSKISRQIQIQIGKSGK